MTWSFCAKLPIISTKFVGTSSEKMWAANLSFQVPSTLSEFLKYCWCFRNPASTSWGEGSFSHYFQGVLYIPGGCLGFHPPTEALPFSYSSQMYQTLQVGTLFRHEPNAFWKLTDGGAPQLILRMNTWNSDGYIIRVTYIYIYIHSSDTGIYHVIHKKQKSPKYLVQDAMHPLMLPPLPLLQNRRALARHPSRPHGGCRAPAEKKGGAKSKARFWNKMLSNWESCKIPGMGWV